jgi:hypothetical protein
VKTKWLSIVFCGPPNNITTVSFDFVCSKAEIIAIFYFPQLSSLFLPLRQVAPPAQQFVDLRPLLGQDRAVEKKLSIILNIMRKLTNLLLFESFV